MSSPARRALRTSVAAAGIAALGVGLAGSALAAPPLPALPGGDGQPAVPALPAVPQLPATPAAPSVEGAVLPGFAYAEVPEVNTASPELPAGDAFVMPEVPTDPAASGVPAVPGPAASELPRVSPTEDAVDAGVEQDGAPTGIGEGQNDLGAIQALDMAALVQDMAQTATAGGSPAEGRQIG